MRRLTLTSALLCAGLAACSSGASAPQVSDGQSFPADTSADSRIPAPDAPDGFTVHQVATVADPWAMVFLPDSDQFLLTRRTGQLELRTTTDDTVIEVAGVPAVVAAGQGGLGDVVLSPGFAQDRTVYLSWVEQGEGGTGAAIGRGRLEVDGDSARLTDFSRIWQQEPKTSGNGHFSHRMVFSPDGQYLFVSSGDRQKMDPAQDLDSTLGKVLRLNPDGTPADGNPFADRSEVSAQLWTYGHRNPLGLAFDADGNLWSSEMGPRGGDELNLIVEGKNYGWPRASDGSHYDGSDIPDHTGGDGFEPPKQSWNPSISPGSLMIYRGDVWPQWQGDAFLGALSGQALLRVELSGTEAGDVDRWEMGARIREVEQAPDGTIWLAEDGAQARLLQLTPSS